MDMSAFVIPKSDQLNADDLISGPRTIRIMRVSGTNNAEQPVAVFFEGDDGKPFKPCKSMRRVMIAAWGVDAAQYVGRSMTLYCDPAVMFGGMRVGGIRISHMSHIERPLNLALTVTKAKRVPYKVSVLPVTKHHADAPAVPPLAAASAAGPGAASVPIPQEPQSPAGTLSPEKTPSHRIPVANPKTGQTQFADTLPNWITAVEEMIDVLDPHDVWEANLTTFTQLLQAAKSDAAKTALSALDATVKAACSAAQAS